MYRESRGCQGEGGIRLRDFIRPSTINIVNVLSRVKQFIEMDWTGGTRRRYAKGKENVILQKQKAHFSNMAKASAPHPPSTPPFMREARRRPCRQHSTRSRISRSSTPSRRQENQPREPDEHSSSGRHVQKTQSLTPTPELDEAHRLRAQKKKLLARSDWLGLAAARPLRLKFNQDRGNDRIGKRRKIHRPSDTHVFQKQRERIPTPPFQAQPFDPIMSGALPVEDIKIKLGTDAVASQMHISRQFQPPLATSIRPISVESEPLSEESMLLGVDEDGFEAGSAQPLLHRFTQSPAKILNHRADSDTFFPATHGPFEPDQDDTLTLQSWTVPSANDGDPNAIDMEHRALTYDWQQREQVDPWSEKRPEEAQMYIPSNIRTAQHRDIDSRSDTPITRRSHDEGMWQRALSVKQGIATQASVVVLRSSSAHDSESDWGVSPIQNFVLPQHEQGNNMAPADGGVQIREQVQPNQLQEAYVNETDSTPIATSRPFVNTNDQVPNDESLWREFIIDSQDRESVSADGISKIFGVYQNDSEPLSPAPRSTPPANSYEAKSDRVTIGDSNLTIQSSAVLSHDNSRKDINTSLAGHATTHLPEETFSNESNSVSHKREGHTIPIPRTSTRAHQRFKGKRRQMMHDRDVPESTRLFKTFCPTSTRATAAHTKSIYSVPSSA
ncbi:hypothetical protein AC578_10001 [Pseudocercospora eumusae]|uniref:Uncharacterized protein n=1 Tax=Pseudocercospora eumusae TaxID=321146 RepID=A0A139HM20_9PEZI|nr:hypothetical protein AC578_10001 [Pseudocercospora eumusae]